MADDDPPGFTVSALPKAGFLGRLVGRVSREAVFIEIRNLLATTSFDQVRPTDVSAALANASFSSEMPLRNYRRSSSMPPWYWRATMGPAAKTVEPLRFCNEHSN
jgi:hypothetical protein